MTIAKLLGLLCVLGLFLIFSDSFIYSVREFLYTIRPKKQSKGSALEKHLIRVIAPIAEDRDIQKVISNLYLITVIVFALVFIVTFRMFGASAIVFALIFAAVPYLAIRVKLAVAQRNGSFEGDILIKELRNQYRYNYKNMLYAIDRTVYSLDDTQRFTKKALTRLSMRLKTYQDEEELREILEDFRFSYNTRWAKMLVQNIYNAVVDHTDVTAGLENLLDVCKEIGTNIEKEKQSTSQIAAMTTVLSPALVVLFYFLAIKMLSLKEVLHVQFHTPAGSVMFMVIIISVLVNMAGSTLLKHPKYDL